MEASKLMNEGVPRRSALQRVPWSRLILVPWFAAIALATWSATNEPSTASWALTAALIGAFLLMQLQTRLSQRALYRGLRELEKRLEMASYTDEFKNMPNRNYLLDQLRREMPRARAFREPFSLVIVSIEDLDGISERRGENYRSLVVRSLARLIERFTRASDFAAQLGEGCYCVLLYDCTQDMARSYLRRIPGSLAVSTGKQMLEVPLTVRTKQYDMESLYAIDVLREVEEEPPARAPEPLRHGAEAA